MKARCVRGAGAASGRATGRTNLETAMTPNPLMTLAAIDRHSDDATCCANNFCRACGSHVSGYTCNANVIAQRPAAAEWDWWQACDNADCEHAYGEGLFQFQNDWVVKYDQIFLERRKPHGRGGGTTCGV